MYKWPWNKPKKVEPRVFLTYKQVLNVAEAMTENFETTMFEWLVDFNGLMAESDNSLVESGNLKTFSKTKQISPFMGEYTINVFSVDDGKVTLYKSHIHKIPIKPSPYAFC